MKVTRFGSVELIKGQGGGGRRRGGTMVLAVSLNCGGVEFMEKM